MLQLQAVTKNCANTAVHAASFFPSTADDDRDHRQFRATGLNDAAADDELSDPRQLRARYWETGVDITKLRDQESP